MKLYLIRHAVAFQRDHARWPDDTARPLTPEGAAKFYMASEGLRQVAPTVDVSFSSTLARGWQTAGILRQVCGWPEPVLTSSLAPEAPPRAALAEMRSLGTPNAVALTGHEPYLSRILGSLVAGRAAQFGLQFTEGAVACLEVDASLSPGSAALRWMMPQGILRRIRRKRRLEEPLAVDDLVTLG